jgi:hypothetical protein
MRPLSKAHQEALTWFENGFADIPSRLLVGVKPHIYALHPTFPEWIQVPEHRTDHSQNQHSGDFLECLECKKQYERAIPRIPGWHVVYRPRNVGLAIWLLKQKVSIYANTGMIVYSTLYRDIGFYLGINDNGIDIISNYLIKLYQLYQDSFGGAGSITFRQEEQRQQVYKDMQRWWSMNFPGEWTGEDAFAAFPREAIKPWIKANRDMIPIVSPFDVNLTNHSSPIINDIYIDDEEIFWDLVPVTTAKLRLYFFYLADHLEQYGLTEEVISKKKALFPVISRIPLRKYTGFEPITWRNGY